MTDNNLQTIDIPAEITHQEIKKAKFNPIVNMGDKRCLRGPGRPVGSKNRFTLIKESMLDIYQEENGKEHFRLFFRKEFSRALDKIIAIMPKEPSISIGNTNMSLTQTVIVPNDQASDIVRNQLQQLGLAKD